MLLKIQSICSSSAGNCLALWSEKTRILIDCGLSSMKRTRQVLTSLFGDPPQIDSVLLTHTHGDHISYYPLRVLDDYGHTIRLHDDSVDQLKDNILTMVDAIVKARPPAAKGRYLRSISISSTMGPGIRLDTQHLTSLLEDFSG